MGCAAAALGIVLADAALRGQQPGFLALAAPLMLAGLGFGIVVVPATSVALATVPPEQSGMAAAATTTSRELGTLLGVAVLGSLVNGQLASGLSQRLASLGVPAAFRGLVINGVETGQVPKGSTASASPPATARWWPRSSAPPTPHSAAASAWRSSWRAS